MDMDVFGIDALLDLSNDQLFISSAPSSSSSSTSTTTASTLCTTSSENNHHHFSYLDYNPTSPATSNMLCSPTSTTNFTDHLCVPNDDIAELEWLSKFVDDSFTEFPTYSDIGTMNVPIDASLFKSSSRFKTKRSHPVPSALTDQTAKSLSNLPNDVSSNVKDTSTVVCQRERSPASPSTEMMPRRCTHCSSEKTPQWRTGPLGPKTLCNACGVRYKSGRLVPEYRPAASPTFVLTQHSNSHRKVMELRRQKELLRQQQQQQQELYGSC